MSGGVGSYTIWLKHDGFQALVMQHRTNRCHYFHLMFFDYCYARVSAGFVQDQCQKFCLSSPTLSACMRVGRNRGFCCSMFTNSQQNHNQNCFLCQFSWHMICSFWEWKSEVCVLYTPVVRFLMKCAVWGHCTLNKIIWTLLMQSSHMLHVLQFAVLQGPGFSFSWKVSDNCFTCPKTIFIWQL